MTKTVQVRPDTSATAPADTGMRWVRLLHGQAHIDGASTIAATVNGSTKRYLLVHAVEAATMVSDGRAVREVPPGCVEGVAASQITSV